MSQQSHTTPTVTTGNRQQVNLRDYLNQRVAPFLKKAIHESLDSQAEYPLQWLGEHLIQQSIMYEGNPDSTGIKERFLYKHDVPSGTTSSNTTTAPVAANAAVNTATATAPMDDVVEDVSVTSPPKESENDATLLTNGVYDSTEAGVVDHDAVSPVAGDGVAQDGLIQDGVPRDTEMGGTS